MLMSQYGLSPVLGILLCLVIGTVVGLLNGFLVSVAGLPSFIVTLAGLSTRYQTLSGFDITPVVGFVRPGARRA